MTNILPPEESPTPTPTSQAATEAPIAPEVRPKKEKRKAGLGTWALFLGIIGIIFAFIPNASGFGIFLGVMAAILGSIGLLRKRDRALAGTILGLVALILGIIFVSVYSSSSSVSPAPAAGSSKATGLTPPPAAPAETAAQLQALTAAKGYLISGIGFSQASLLAQLTSSSGNGFAQADAQYGVDHSGADWNAQAVIAAKAYLIGGVGFSQASLLAQLTSPSGNQFTAAQAQSAVDHSGADWNAQAAIAAKAYVASGIGFSRTSLIEQLTSASGNQFTAAQAQYAADQVGLK